MKNARKLKNRLWDEKFQDGLQKILMIALAAILSLVIGSFFILSKGVNPLEAYRRLLISPYTSLGNIGEILVKVTPVLIVAVGVAFAGKAKLTNLGGEGQLYMGALGGLLIAVSPAGKLPAPVALILGMLAGAAFGALWGGIAGLFKAKFKANEIITSLLLNYIAVQLIGFLVHGPLREPKGLMPQSARIPSAMELPRLFKGMRAHTGILIALFCVVVLFIVIGRTSFGYNLRVLGGSTRAAAYSGINAGSYYIRVMLLSGGFAGFAGAIEVYGVQYRLLEGMAGSYGFTGVVVALLGFMHPLGIAVAAFLMSGLTVGAEIAQVSTGVPVTLVSVLQGMIVLFVLWGLSVKRKKAVGQKAGGESVSPVEDIRLQGTEIRKVEETVCLKQD